MILKYGKNFSTEAELSILLPLYRDLEKK